MDENQQQQSQTQEQATYAGFWVRLAAFQIDVALFSIIAITLQSPTLKLLTAISFFLYTTFFTSLYGATLGKKLFKIKVSKNNNNPSLPTTITREILGKGISYLIFGIGFFWIAFDKEKQGIHDKIASTHVILTQPLTGFRKTLVVVFKVLLILQLLLLVLGLASGSFLTAIDPSRNIRGSIAVNTAESSLTTYKNDELGWTIGYDPNLFGKPSKVIGINAIQFSLKGDHCNDSFMVLTKENPEGSSLDKYVSTYTAKPEVKPIEINGARGIKILTESPYVNDGISHLQHDTTYFFSKTQKIILINYNDNSSWRYTPEDCQKSKEILKRTIETFKIE